jgi:hypothetical protein
VEALLPLKIAPTGGAPTRKARGRAIRSNNAAWRFAPGGVIPLLSLARKPPALPRLPPPAPFAYIRVLIRVNSRFPKTFFRALDIAPEIWYNVPMFL